MTKEFENIQKIVASKQSMLDIQTRKNQQEAEQARIAKEKDKQQEEINSEKRSANNKKFLEDIGVVKLFQEIIDKKLVIDSNEPLYKKIPTGKYYPKNRFTSYWLTPPEEIYKEVKVSDYSPAIISWGKENNYVALWFNSRSWKGSGDEPGGSEHNLISFFVPNNNNLNPNEIKASMFKGAMYSDSRNNEIRYGDEVFTNVNINEIPSYIAEQISQTLKPKC